MIYKERLPVVNLLRAFASMMIVCYHYLTHCDEKKILILSISGTSFFYCLTGFFIPIFYEKINSLKKFLVRRFLRLYPALLFVTFVSLFILYFIKGEKSLFHKNIDLKNILLNITFIHHFFPSSVKFIQDTLYIMPAWTINMNITFYLVLIITYAIFKTNKTRINFIVIMHYILYFIILYVNKKYKSFYMMHQVSMCILPFYFGMTFRFYKEQYITKKHFYILSVFIFLPLFLSDNNGYIKYVIGCLVVAYLLTYYKDLGNNNKIVMFLSNISYPMFLLHGIVPALLWPGIGCCLTDLNELRFFTKKSGFWFFILYPLMIPICYFIYRFIENPLNNLGRKITAKMK